jgi:ferrous iron transport protein B
MNSEVKSKKWLFAGVGLQLAVGYTVGFLVFFFGNLFTGGSFGEAWMPLVGWAIIAAITAVFTFLIVRRNRKPAEK